MPQFDANGDEIQEPLRDAQGNEMKDATGMVIMKPSSEPANVVSCLDYFLMDFPQNQWTMKHIAESTRLHAKLAEVKEQKLDHFELEDAQYKWLIGVLKNDKIGVPMFRMNLVSLLKAIGETEIKEE